MKKEKMRQKSGKGGITVVNTVVVRPTIQQTFERFLQQERVLFFSAPCGFGKTTVARELAGEKGVLYLTAETPDFSMPA